MTSEIKPVRRYADIIGYEGCYNGGYLCHEPVDWFQGTQLVLIPGYNDISGLHISYNIGFAVYVYNTKKYFF